MSGAVAALHFVGKYDAVFPHPYCMAYLLGTLLLDGDGLNGTCGTNLRAAVALGATIALVILHDGLHQILQVFAGTQHLIGTIRNAKLTSRAMLGEMLG